MDKYLEFCQEPKFKKSEIYSSKINSSKMNLEKEKSQERAIEILGVGKKEVALKFTTCFQIQALENYWV